MRPLDQLGALASLLPDAEQCEIRDEADREGCYRSVEEFLAGQAINLCHRELAHEHVPAGAATLSGQRSPFELAANSLNSAVMAVPLVAATIFVI